MRSRQAIEQDMSAWRYGKDLDVVVPQVLLTEILLDIRDLLDKKQQEITNNKAITWPQESTTLLIKGDTTPDASTPCVRVKAPHQFIHQFIPGKHHADHCAACSCPKDCTCHLTGDN